MIRPIYLLLLSAAVPLVAQPPSVTFGLKGGMPAQTPLGQTDDQMPFVLGPSVDIKFSSRFSIETGVLVHRLGRDVGTGIYLYPENAVTLTSSNQRARAFEVPVLAKIHLRNGRPAWRSWEKLPQPSATVKSER